MTDAAIGYGSDFRRSDGAATPVYTTIGEVHTITPPSIGKDVVDATHMNSPDGYREFIPGLKDAGEASVELVFVPNAPEVAVMIADVESDAAHDYEILFPDATAWRFTALATGFEPGVPMDDKMTATFTLKLTGRPAFAENAP